MPLTINNVSLITNAITDAPLGTGLLAFRDLAVFLKQYSDGNKALDFGCGAGRSTRFLNSLGFDVIGVDISSEMLQKAKSMSNNIDYRQIDEGFISSEYFGDTRFNLIFLSFVTMEIPSIESLIRLFKQLKSVMDENGRIIVIAASDNLYTGNWLSMDTSYTQNSQAKSGEIVKVYLKDYDIEISDFLWKESDCEHVFSVCNLSVLKKSLPLGEQRDNRAWLDEVKMSPFVVYHLRWR